MFDRQKPIPKKSEQRREDCEIEIKKTAQGKKIRFRGNCTKEQVSAFAKDNDMDLD